MAGLAPAEDRIDEISVETGDLFEIRLRPPPPAEKDLYLIDSAWISTAGFYDLPIDRPLGGAQISILLSVRDYALAVAERVSPSSHGRANEWIARFAAALILQDGAMVASIHSWMRDWFDSAPDRDALPLHIDRTPEFPAVEAFLAGTIADMTSKGADFSTYRKPVRNRYHAQFG